MGAPRVNRADAWRKRPCVLRYHAFKDAVKKAVADTNIDFTRVVVLFLLPMRKTWKPATKAAKLGTPHTSTPDIDNLEKALYDAVCSKDAGGDAHIWRNANEKRWAEKGAIEIYERLD